MDWSKAKSILIVVLVFVNIILLSYVGFDYIETMDRTLTKSFIAKTVDMLQEKDIKVEAKIPRKKYAFNSLRVEFQSRKEEELNEAFFNGMGTIQRPSRDLATLEYHGDTLSIVNQRRILFESERLEEQKKGKTVEREAAIALAEEFLNERGYSTVDMEPTSFRVEEGVSYLEFSKKQDDIFMESSYTNFEIDSQGIIMMDRLWLNKLDVSENSIELPSASKALLSFLTKPEYYHSTIVDISPCYYFNPEEQGYVEDITKAQQGRAIPAWRIQLEDGDEIVIDIY